MRYNGSMNRRQRDAAVEAFTEEDEVVVMLMSQKAGGVGLVRIALLSAHAGS